MKKFIIFLLIIALPARADVTFPTPPLTGGLPTIASGACGTGANGTVTAGSTSIKGNITVGASATTTCTVVFAAGSSFAVSPICTLTAANATAIGALILAYISSNTTTQFVITGAVLASTNWNYHCV